MGRPLYDVLEVSVTAPFTVRVIAEGLTEESAEARVMMAVLRRGVETHFFTAALAGSHKDGDEWKG